MNILFHVRLQYKILASGCLHVCCGFKSTVNEDVVESGIESDKTTNTESHKNQNDYRSSLLVSPMLLRSNASSFFNKDHDCLCR